jgi:hypothetical protein
MSIVDISIASNVDCGKRTLSSLGCWVAAVGAGVLLNVERTATCGCAYVISMMFLSANLPTLESFQLRKFCPFPFSSSSRMVSTYRIVGRGRGSCCGVYRSWTFPSL